MKYRDIITTIITCAVLYTTGYLYGRYDFSLIPMEYGTPGLRVRDGKAGGELYVGVKNCMPVQRRCSITAQYVKNGTDWYTIGEWTPFDESDSKFIPDIGPSPTPHPPGQIG